MKAISFLFKFSKMEKKISLMLKFVYLALIIDMKIHFPILFVDFSCSKAYKVVINVISWILKSIFIYFLQLWNPLKRRFKCYKSIFDPRFGHETIFWSGFCPHFPVKWLHENDKNVLFYFWRSFIFLFWFSKTSMNKTRKWVPLKSDP